MSIPAITVQFTKLFDFVEHAPKGNAEERMLTERKIHQFVLQNKKAFQATDVDALKDLRKQAIRVGDEHSKTVQLIDSVIHKYDEAIENKQKEVIQNYNNLMKDVSYHDPSKLRYEADALWALRDKGVYLSLMQNGVLQTVVYSLYQAAANLAEKQWGPGSGDEFKQLGFDVLAEIPPDAHTPSYKDYEQFLKQFIAGEKKPFNLAQAHLFFERHTSRFMDHPLHNQKLYREAQRILTEAGLPSNALATRLQILARDQTMRTAQLPRTGLETITKQLDSTSLVRLLEADPHLIKNISTGHASELLNKLDEASEPVKPEIYYALALLAGEQVEALNLENYRDLTDNQLKKLLLACPNLTHLSLDGCDKLTAKGIQELAKLAPQLKALSLADCKQFTDNMLLPLRSLYALEILDLSECSITSRLFSAFHFPALHTLRLVNTKITDDALVAIRAWPSLKHLNLARCSQLTDVGIQALPPLITLSLNRIPNLTALSIRHLKKMETLTALSLVECGQEKFFEDPFLTILCREIDVGSFPNLRLLDISRNIIESENELLTIYALTTLKEIYVIDLNKQNPENQDLKIPAAVGATAAFLPYPYASGILGLGLWGTWKYVVSLITPVNPPDSNRTDLIVHK